MNRLRLRNFASAIVLFGVVGMASPAFAQEGDAPQPTAAPQADSAAETTAGDDSAPPPLSASLVQSVPEEETFQLGQPIEVRLDIVHPPRTDVIVPEAVDSGRWDLLDASQETVEEEEEWRTTVAMTFGVFRPGVATLDPVPIRVVGESGEATVMTEPLEVKIVSALEGDEALTFQDPRDTVAVWVEDYTLAWAAGIAGTALLFGLLFFGWRRRQQDWEPPPPPRPAHEVALEKLGALAADDLVERGEYMLYYVRLSEAVREFLGRAHGFKAVEMTTTEIVQALDEARSNWPPALSHDDVRDLLYHCDAVKFGGLVPSEERAAKALRDAFALVEALKPRPVVRETPVDQQPEAERERERDVIEQTEDSKWAPPETNDAPAEDLEPELADEPEPEPAPAEEPEPETAAAAEPTADEPETEPEPPADEPSPEVDTDGE